MIVIDCDQIRVICRFNRGDCWDSPGKWVKAFIDN